MEHRRRTFVVLAAMLAMLVGAVSGSQCSWEYEKTSVVCRLRTLERTGLDLQGAEGTTRLDIQCSELILFESQLPRNSFARLAGLGELRLESCKLLQLPEGAFEGLTALKKLAVNTRNYEWGPGKVLELQAGSMRGLKELQSLDLSDNNIRALPDGFLCPLTGLKVLNLTNNRFRSAEALGLAEKSCTGGSELQSLNLAYNELRAVPENWGVSKLRRLQHLNLEYNNISEVHGDALAGLSSLRTLNLSYNHLETLPAGMFAGSRDLREIHLQGNQIYELPRGLFHRLEQLLVLDLSRNQLSSHHVDNGTFSGLIRLVVLNLAHNALTRIDAKTFKELYFLQILDLRNNSIGYIEDNAFLPVYNLHTLNLAENRLHTLDDRLFNGLFVLSKLTLNNNLISIVEPNVFKNCSDLKELDLSSNQLTEVPYAIRDLSMLRALDLGENQISRIENGTFSNLNQLTGLRMIDNQIENITIGMFTDLPRLSVLNLAKNRVQNIERGSFDKNLDIEAIRLDGNFLTDINGIFATLSSLLWLNLAENHLVWFDYAFIPSNLKWLDIHGNYIESLGNYYKLQEEIKVKTLDASHNRLTDLGPMNVPNSVELLFVNDNHIGTIHANTFIDKINLARVDLYANALKKLQLHQLRVAPAPTEKPLPEFYLGGNPFECDCSMEWMQRVNNLTTRQHPKIMDLPNVECIMPHARGSPIRPIVSLKPKDFLCRYETHCFALCHCCDFDACDCEMTCPSNCTCYHDQTWSTNVVDCGGQQAVGGPRPVPMDATEVYLDGNDFPELQNHAFIGRKNLKVLYANASRVVTIQNRTFAGLTALQVLHLEDNALQRIHGYEFENLGLLRELYLQNNAIQTIANGSFAPLYSLRVLRIDGNRLSQMPLFQLQATQLQSLQALSLGRNQWSCRCRFMQELTTFVADNAVIVQDMQDVYCVDDGVHRELDFNVSAACSDFYAGRSVLPDRLSETYIFLLAGALILACLLVFVLVVFIFREPLRFWLFSRYGVRVFGPRCEDSEKLYDAILVYSAKDAEFVQRNIAAELENGRPPLRLCLQHRDLPEDASHLQLLEASRASRRIVMILSRNFLQTEWSRCELRRAIHDALRGRPYKLVVIEEGGGVLLEAENDVELVPYLKTTTVTRVRRGDRHFWEKLRYALPVEAPYRGNNYTIDHHERIKQTGGATAGVMFRQPPPPAYCPEIDEANYSSATTATPSPRPSRRGMVEIPQRPPSEHIYSSIDSDYSTLECENMVQAGVHRPTWRSGTGQVMVGNGAVQMGIVGQAAAAAAAGAVSGAPNGGTMHSNHGHHVQAYLV
ncbi:toll-like receptor 7 [Anopheles ziemanni]|uniref:toll-like receptor 7 n=1 Tax=Anopheles coustani TaxID=139045 RepID=UPI002659FED8|nr:toll-like receptor 7 [Anopheles coustani]XP_058170666.1 toll-like receptor 7 [Anopheles ziemanni]